MRLLLILSSALLLAACSTLPSYDDPRIRNIEPGEYTVTLDVTVYDTFEEVGRRCNFGIPLPEYKRIFGCAFMRAEPTRLVIMAPRDANDLDAMGAIGHEFLHGMFGDWHLQRDGR